ncbi:MAG: sigma-70 family RNA polymerase sigma factor [Bryobacteraceae bacterium]|nr:sigma-70 family RNA polymerase sigma factor [Bryobacteraceae bacterium]
MMLFSKSTGGGAAVRAALDPQADSSALPLPVPLEAPQHEIDSGSPDEFVQIVARVRNNDPRGLEDLYACFARGARFYFCRHLGLDDLDDRIHDSFLLVVDRIKHGELREPARLMGFIRTILRRQVATYVRTSVEDRRDFTTLDSESEHCLDFRGCPEERIIDSETVGLMERTMRGMSAREREILTRFYLLEQSPAFICKEMRLNMTQFRLMKSRAKGRFGVLGRRSIGRESLECLNENTSA